MLHEILLSLSGHPSPLLRTDNPEPHPLSGITPAERQLLASVAHLSDVHVKLIAYTAEIINSHPSVICRAVAAAIQSVHLSAFQRKVLEVEESVLKDDPNLVGAYDIVPLTAIVGEFRLWMRRMDWLWETVQYMLRKDGARYQCHGADLMNRLRGELQSGYEDVKQTSLSLVTAAEMAWLKQVSAWILYGRLPAFGEDDFFIREDSSSEGYTIISTLLPSFVTPSTAASMLFIGKSLNHVRVKAMIDSGLRGLDQLSSKLRELTNLTFPLESAAFSRSVVAIRTSLSQNTLQKILPLEKVVEMLELLRDFFLLRRGEFAMALTHEADDRIRHRWRRADNLAYEKKEGVGNVTVKDGEVAAVLTRTWAMLASMQSQHAEEDEQLELARSLLRLGLVKATGVTPLSTGPGFSPDAAKLLATSPFRNLLFAVPATLSLQLPSPLDMVLSPSDLEMYSRINSYLLGMRRAHIRLTDLWKISSLRRHHPTVRGADEHAVMLRQRWSDRSSVLRSSWTTTSAAVFFLGEVEAYLQTEVVAGLWDGFYGWMTRPKGTVTKAGGRSGATTPAQSGKQRDDDMDLDDEDEEDDLWLQDETSGTPKAKAGDSRPSHDPQTLSTAHTRYLRTLVHRLLITQPTYTQPLYTLLTHIDHLVTHIQRLHSIFTSIDLETDAGVVDAFLDLEREEREVKAMLHGVERKVRRGIEDVIAALRGLEGDAEFMAEWEGEAWGAVGEEEGDGFGGEDGRYVPARVGGINRLLMKLDFGSWFV